MGLDWERLSLSGYIEALTAKNEADTPDKANSTPKKVGDDLWAVLREKSAEEALEAKARMNNNVS